MHIISLLENAENSNGTYCQTARKHLKYSLVFVYARYISIGFKNVRGADTNC